MIGRNCAIDGPLAFFFSQDIPTVASEFCAKKVIPSNEGYNLVEFMAHYSDQTCLSGMMRSMPLAAR